MKQLNCRLDFLPNKQNKYSIRKFTVGTASTLVGAAFMFGLSHDVQAAEEQPSSTDITHIQSDSSKLNSDIASQPTKIQETQLSAVVTPPVTTEAPASENTAPHNPESNTTTFQTPTTIESAPQLQSQSKEVRQSQKDTTPESISAIEATTKSTPTMHTRTKRALDLKVPVEQTKAPVSHETYSGRIIDYTGSDLVTKVEHPGQTVAPDYIDFSPVFKDSDSKTYAFLTNKGTVASKKVTTTNGGGIYAYQGDYIMLNDSQPEAYVYINNVGIASGHKVDAWIHVKMDPPSTQIPTNARYFFTSGRDMLSMTSQDGGGATAHIKFLSNIDKTKLEDLYNSVATDTPIDSVKERIKGINNTPHPVSGLLNIYDLDDYDPHKAADVRKSVTFNRNDINELYISNKPASEATANLELKDNKVIISTGEHPKGGVDDYPNRVTAAFKNKSELTYSMTGRNVSGTAFHVKGILLVPVQPYTVQVHNSIDKQDTKVSLTQYIPTREAHQTATLPTKIEMTAEFPQGIIANVQSNNAYFTATQNNSNKVIIAHSNTALKQQGFYDKTYTFSITLKHNLTVEDIRSNSEKWTKLKTYYDGNVLNVPVKWSFDNGTKQFENLITDYQTIPLALSDALKNELDKQIMAEATASVEAAKRAHAHAQTTAQTITTDQLVSKNEVDGLKNEIQAVTTKKNDAQAKVNHLPERLKTTLQQELNQLTTIGLPEVNDEDNNAISDDQDKLIAEATQRLTEAQEAETKAKKTLTEADVNHAISPDEHQHLVALQQDFTTKKKAAGSKIKAVHAQYQSPLIEKLNQLVGINVPKVNDTNHNGQPDIEEAKAQQDAMLKNTEDLVQKAEAAAQAAEIQLQQVNKDNLIKPKEQQDLTVAKANADTTKAAANTSVKALPSELQASLLDRLAKLKDIAIPDVNDNNDNNIPDNQDTLIAEAKDLLTAAKAAEKLVQTELTQADNDKAINQQEHDRLANLQQDFITKKQAVNNKIMQIEERHRSNLPTQLELLNGIVIPDINDKDNNGKPDTVDQADLTALLKVAQVSVDKAKAADSASKRNLADATQDQLINPQEHHSLTEHQQTVVSTKAAAAKMINVLPETSRTPLEYELQKLDGIVVPDINDKNSNMVPDSQDTLVQTAEAAIEKAAAADALAKNELAKTTEHQVISPKTHQLLANLQQDFEQKKASAQQVLNVVDSAYQGALPGKLKALTGIEVPKVNDQDGNGRADDLDEKAQQASTLKALTALVEKAESADRTAQVSLQTAQDDSLITPKEYTELTSVEAEAVSTKAAAHKAVNDLSPDKRTSLMDRLVRLTGITVPSVTDNNENHIPDTEDQLVQVAEDLLKQAKAADQAAKALLAKALDPNRIIDLPEQQALSAVQADFERKKALANEKINAIQLAYRKDLPQQLAALTGIKVPEINDEDKNGIRDDVDQAIHKAKAAVEAAKATYHNALTQAEDIQKDGITTPEESTELSKAITLAATKKTDAQAQVNVVLSEPDKQALQAELDALTTIKTPQVNDENHNGVPDKADRLFDEAVKAYEAAKAAEVKAQSFLEEVQADDVVNPDEHKQMNVLQAVFKQNQAFAAAKIKEVDSRYRQGLPEKIQMLTGIDIPSVNDQNRNGIRDDIDTFIDKAQQLINAVKDSAQAAHSKLDEATADGLINPNELASLNEAKHLIGVKKLEAQTQIDALPSPYQKDLQLRLNAIDEITLPAVNDRDSNQVDDHTDALKTAVQGLIDEAKRVHKSAQQRLATVQQDELITPKEWSELNHQAKAAKSAANNAQKAVDKIAENLRPEFQTQLDLLKAIDLPEINDTDSNGIDDKQDQFIREALQALKATQAAEDVAKVGLATAQNNDVINVDEHEVLSNLQTAFLAHKKIAEEKVVLVNTSLASELSKMLDALTGIEVPEINDYNHNDVDDVLDQTFQDSIARVKAAYQTLQDDLAQVNVDGLVTPNEQATLVEVQNHVVQLKERATETLQQSSLPTAVKAERLDALSHILPVSIPEINDQNENDIEDSVDARVDEAKVAVNMAQKADKHAQLLFDAAVSDNLITPEEQASLKVAQDHAQTLKTYAEIKVSGLPSELKGDLPTLLVQLKGITIPGVNDANTNGTNDIQDQWVNNAEVALKQATSLDNTAQMELEKVLVDHRVQSEEHEALAIIQESVKAAKLLAQAAIAQLPTELKGNLISELNHIKNIEIPTVTEENLKASVETVPNEVQQDEFEISHSHATQRHLENTEKTSLHQMISKTHMTPHEVEQEAEVKDKNTHQDMTAREAVSSEKSSLATDKHHETTQAHQIDEDEAASSESINDFQNNEAHASQTLSHTTTKTAHSEHTISSQSQKVLPHTGKLVSNGILGGSIVVLIGLASLVSHRRRKN